MTALPHVENKMVNSVDNLSDKASRCTGSTVGDEDDEDTLSEGEMETIKGNPLYEKIVNWACKKEAEKQASKEEDANKKTSNLISQMQSILSMSPPHFIKALPYEALKKPDLPCSGYVSITYASTPEIFSVRVNQNKVHFIFCYLFIL